MKVMLTMVAILLAVAGVAWSERIGEWEFYPSEYGGGYLVASAVNDEFGMTLVITCNAGLFVEVPTNTLLKLDGDWDTVFVSGGEVLTVYEFTWHLFEDRTSAGLIIQGEEIETNKVWASILGSMMLSDKVRQQVYVEGLGTQRMDIGLDGFVQEYVKCVHGPLTSGDTPESTNTYVGDYYVPEWPGSDKSLGESPKAYVWMGNNFMRIAFVRWDRVVLDEGICVFLGYECTTSGGYRYVFSPEDRNLTVIRPDGWSTSGMVKRE